jgi:hypothetical protein
MLIVISDSHFQETDLTQFHQLNIQTILLLRFCLYVEQVRSLCRVDEISVLKKVKRDRNISSKLVHIEHVIGLAKTFKIIIFASNRTEANFPGDILFQLMQ